MIETHLPVNGSINDLMLNIFREYFKDTDVTVVSKVSESTPRPFVWIRTDRRSGATQERINDRRFQQTGIVNVWVIHDGADGRDADVLGEQIQEACRVVFMEAQRQQKVYPSIGSLSSYMQLQPPTRVSDWGDSTNVVQYATLPVQWERWASTYRVVVRPDHHSTNQNPYVHSSPRGMVS